MFKLGQAAGLLALQSKYCNPDAVPLQKQHNDKCTLKKLMEYSIDTFSKKDNDSGETSDAADEGDPAAQSQQQNNSTKGGGCGRSGVSTAKSQCSKTPGKDTNQTTKSSCCGGGGCCGKRSQQYKNNECSSEKLAKSTCAGTKKTWKETISESIDTVTEYADNVITGIKNDLCASQPFPECRSCPYRTRLGQSNSALGVPDFMRSIDSAIDALTRGAVGSAIDMIGCPGIAGAIARGDFAELGAAMVDSGIRSLVSSAISAGSVPVLDSLMSVLPTDMRQTLMDPHLVGNIMQAATCGGSSSPSKRRRSAKDLKTTAAKAKMASAKATAKAKPPKVGGATAKFIETATPPQLIAFIVKSNDEDEIIAAIVAAGDDADEIVAKAIAAKEAQENGPLAAFVDGIYTGTVGAQSAGADLSWFDELVNTIIATGNSGDTFFLITPEATSNIDAKFVMPDEYTGSKPIALLDYEGREFRLTDEDKEAITAIKTVVTAAGALLDSKFESDKDKGKVYALMLDKCPSAITSETKAIDVKALRMKSNCPVYRLTKIPGCTLSVGDLKAAVAVDVINGDRESPVDLQANLVKTDAELLIYR